MKNGAIRKKVWRKAPKDLDSLAFDFYIIDKTSALYGSHGGVIICRNTNDFQQFNSYLWEKGKIIAFIDGQYKKRYGEIGMRDTYGPIVK